jgi:hypothetical protein
MAKRKPPTTLMTPGTTEPPSATTEPADARILSLDEIADIYPDEWILLRVTAREGGRISHGVVVGHWPPVKESDPLITQAMIQTYRATKGTGVEHFLFPAHHFIRTGEEMRKALEELSRSGKVPRRVRWF